MGTAIPVDPGDVIDATAPKRTAFRQSVDVAGAGASQSISVPELAVDPGAPPLPGEAGASPGSTQRILGLAIAGAGVVGIGIGAVFGLVAMNKENSALNGNDCTGQKYCNAQGLQLGQDAHSAATASTIAFGVGAAAVARRSRIYFLAPENRRHRPSGCTLLARLAAPRSASGAW